LKRQIGKDSKKSSERFRTTAREDKVVFRGDGLGEISD